MSEYVNGYYHHHHLNLPNRLQDEGEGEKSGVLVAVFLLDLITRICIDYDCPSSGTFEFSANDYRRNIST